MAVPKIRFLSRADVRQALPMGEAIAVMKEAFPLLSAGKAVIPQRLHLGIPEQNAGVLVMPSYLPSQAQLGLKIVTIFRDNAARQLPLIQALVMLMDASDGRPLALMEGSSLTALRTGAASGAATDLLARKDSAVAAIFGSGAQAETQLEAVSTVRPLRRAYVFGRDREKTAAFARRMEAQLGLEVLPAAHAENLAEADIVCTATTSSTPVFADRHLKPGVHINGVGSYRPDLQEVPAETVLRAKVVVDERASCWEEAGDLVVPLQNGQITRDHVHAELGEVIGGKKSGRTADDEITFFKSVGNAIQDLTAAGRILHAAEAQGLGVELEL